MPEQNTELHDGINRGVLILWLEQCPESIKKKCLRQEKLKKKLDSVMNYLSFKTNSVLQWKIKNEKQILAGLPKGEAIS